MHDYRGHSLILTCNFRVKNMIGKRIRVGTEEGGREGTPLFSPSRKNGDLFRMTSCVSDPKVISL
jgi:hypothetical protein